MNPLALFLQSVRLEGTVFSRAELAAPFSVKTRGAPSGLFHVVVSGRCQLRVEGTRVVHPLEAGDVALLPHGDAHVLCDRQSTPPRAITTLPRVQDGGLNLLRIRGSGATTELLCGTFHVAHFASHPLIDELPSVVVVGRNDPSVGEWLGATVRLMAAEAALLRPGYEVLLSHLTGTLLVHALRAYSASVPATAAGWIPGMKDPRLARALELMHTEPEQPWSVNLLARRVGMSRSAFYAQFTERVGRPPVEYLTAWRMHLACRALTDETAGVSELAGRLGYGSDVAFIRAFRRVIGKTPGDFRRRVQTRDLRSGVGAHADVGRVRHVREHAE